MLTSASYCTECIKKILDRNLHLIQLMDSFVVRPFMCLMRHRVRVSLTPQVSTQRFLSIPETHIFCSIVRNDV